MAFLKNSIYNFERETIGSYNVVDFTRNNIYKIKDLPQLNDLNYVEFIQMAENETYEYLAYKLYNNEDYWDLILAINGFDPLFDMYFSFEVVGDLAADKLKSYEDDVIKRTVIDNARTCLLNNWENEIKTKNDSKMMIKIIRPNRMQDFIRILKDNGLIKV